MTIRPFKTYIFVFFFILFAVNFVSGASEENQPSISMTAEPQKIYEGESTILRIRVSNSDTNTPPDVDYLNEAFDVEYLGNQPASRSYTITINGKTTHTEEKADVFVYRLTPKKTGVIQIESPILDAGSETISGDPVTVKVIAPEKQDQVYFDLVTNPQKIYPGVPFEVTLTISVKELPGDYAENDPVLLLSSELGPINLAFSWSDDRRLPSGISSEISTSDWLSPYLNRSGGFTLDIPDLTPQFSLFGGLRQLTFCPAPTRKSLPDSSGTETTYRQYKFSRTFTADRAGEIDFGTVSLKGPFVQLKENGKLKQNDIYTVSEPFKVQIQSVPEEGRPSDYIGACGKFTINSNLTPQSVKAGEAVTYTMTLKGTGSVLNTHAPDLASNEQIKSHYKIYPPTEEIGGGQVKWTWSIRPLTGEIESFPPVKLSCFDTEKEQYVTLETEEIPFTVEEGNLNISDFADDTQETDPEFRPADSNGGIYADMSISSIHRTRTFTEWTISTGLIWTAAFLFCCGVRIARKRNKTEKSILTRRILDGEKMLNTALSDVSRTDTRTILDAFLTPAASLFTQRIESVSHAELIRVLNKQTNRFPDNAEMQKTASEFLKLAEELDEARYSGTAPAISKEDVLALYRRWSDLLRKIPNSKRKLAGTKNIVTRSLLILISAGILLPSSGCGTNTSYQSRIDQAFQYTEEADKPGKSESEKAELSLKAAALYEGIIKEKGESGPILYNQGNAYFRAGDKPHALAAWRKAELYMPGNSHLKANIAVLKPNTKPERKSLFDLFSFLPLHTKGRILILLSIAGAIFLTTAEFVQHKQNAKRLRICPAVVFTISLLLFASLCADTVRYHTGTHAITAVTDLIPLKGGSSSYAPVFRDPLPILTECRVLERRNGWIHVRFQSGETGWVEADKVVCW